MRTSGNVSTRRAIGLCKELAILRFSSEFFTYSKLACNTTAGSRVRIDQDNLVVWNTVLAIEGDLREIESPAVPLSDLVDYIALVPVVDVLRMYG